MICHFFVSLVFVCAKKRTGAQFAVLLKIYLISLYDLVISSPFMLLWPFFVGIGDFDDRGLFFMQLFGIIPDQKDFKPSFYIVMQSLSSGRTEITKSEVKSIVVSAFTASSFAAFIFNLMVINNIDYVKNLWMSFVFFGVCLVYLIAGPFSPLIHNIRRKIVADNFPSDSKDPYIGLQSFTDKFEVYIHLYHNFNHPAEWFSEVIVH